MTRYELIRIFSAHEENDKEGGKGGQIFLGYFFDKKQAEAAAAGKGVQNGNGSTNQHAALKLEGGKIFLLQQEGPIEVASTLEESLAARARNKLSQEELAALVATLKK